MQILQTPRLILRQFTPADADPLAQVLGDLETMLYYPEPYDRAGVEQWITRNLQRYRNRRRLAETGCRMKHPSRIFSIALGQNFPSQAKKRSETVRFLPICIFFAKLRLKYFGKCYR